MQLGQCGFQKSGNYLLYRILRGLLEQQGLWSSFAETTRCWEGIARLDRAPLLFPERTHLDEVDVGPDGLLYLRNRQLRAQFALPDPEAFVRQARLVWTHQAPRREHFELLGRERRWLYVVRDGRDAVNSYLHQIVSGRNLQRNPHFRFRDVRELYDRTDYFAKRVREWAAHVRAYLALRDRYLEVRYERLARDRAGTIAEVAERLGCAERVDVEALAQETAVEAMRQQAPWHVRRARAGDWREHFEPRHHEIFEREAGELLRALGYAAAPPRTGPREISLPTALAR